MNNNAMSAFKDLLGTPQKDNKLQTPQTEKRKLQSNSKLIGEKQKPPRASP
jgi:hypothetical protein